jgi:hypothetical protein
MRRLYLPLADVGAIYDSSDNAGMAPIAERTPDASLVVFDRARWALIEEATR